MALYFYRQSRNDTDAGVNFGNTRFRAIDSRFIDAAQAGHSDMESQEDETTFAHPQRLAERRFVPSASLGLTHGTYIPPGTGAYERRDYYRGLYERDKQSPLFYMTDHQVHAAFAHPLMTHAVPALLGLAFLENHGHPLGYDSSLSTHSSGLVKKGLESGVVIPHPDNPTGSQSNYLGFGAAVEKETLRLSELRGEHSEGGPEMLATRMGDWERVPQGQVSEANAFMRHLLGRRRRSAANAVPVISSQFTEPHLPGLEG